MNTHLTNEHTMPTTFQIYMYTHMKYLKARDCKLHTITCTNYYCLKRATIFTVIHLHTRKHLPY